MRRPDQLGFSVILSLPSGRQTYWVQPHVEVNVSVDIGPTRTLRVARVARTSGQGLQPVEITWQRVASIGPCVQHAARHRSDRFL